MSSIRTRTLDTGLRIAAERVPTTGCAVAVSYRAGFRHDPIRRGGMAHLFEHLMFQGSAGVAPGAHFADIQARGGAVNGNTFEDVADYHQTIPAEALPRVLELEADRMHRLSISQRALDIQRQVVLEEIALQVHGKAFGGFPWTVLPATLHDAWSYGHNGFGSRSELESVSLQECHDFYEAFYAPGNAAVAVGADADPEQLLDLVAAAFAQVGARPSPALSPAPLPADPGMAVRVRDPLAPTAALAVGWAVPSLGPDLDELRRYAALLVLSRTLTGGSHTRLRVSLRRHQMSVDTSVGLFGPFLAAAPETFVLVIHHAEGASAIALEAFDAQLEQLAVDPDEQDIVAARRSALGDYYQRMDQIAFRTRFLARGAMLFGRPTVAQDLASALRSVDLADVAKAAASLLAPTPRGIVHVAPGEAK